MPSHALLDNHHVVGSVPILFVYTDRRRWSRLVNEVFPVQVHFDRSPPHTCALDGSLKHA